MLALVVSGGHTHLYLAEFDENREANHGDSSEAHVMTTEAGQPGLAVQECGADGGRCGGRGVRQGGQAAWVGVSRRAMDGCAGEGRESAGGGVSVWADQGAEAQLRRNRRSVPPHDCGMTNNRNGAVSTL